MTTATTTSESSLAVPSRTEDQPDPGPSDSTWRRLPWGSLTRVQGRHHSASVVTSHWHNPIAEGVHVAWSYNIGLKTMNRSEVDSCSDVNETSEWRETLKAGM